MAANNARRSLRYAAPAANFNEALPIGNGRLGAMVYGALGTDRLSLNDDRLWAGGEPPRAREDGPELLAEARRLYFAGERKAAEDLLEARFTTEFNQPYQPAGWLEIDGGAGEGVREYERGLELGTATAYARYSSAAGDVSRDYFVSAERQVIVVTHRAETGILPDARVRLTAELRHEVTVEGGDLVLRGRTPIRVRWEEVDNEATPENYVTYDDELSRRYAVAARIGATDGQVSVDGAELVVTGATRLVVLVAIATDDRGPDQAALAVADLDAAAAHDAEELRRWHLASHAALYDRVSLSLGETSHVPLYTDERLLAVHAGGTDADLLATLFDYGRYLMIASSRPGSMPSNLMGIWNESIMPPWWSNFTLNINLQMNYWPAAATGLLECAEPLYDFVHELARVGAETARVQYGASGWVANHQTDHRLQTTPVGYVAQGPIELSARWALWPFGGAWLCLHLFEHFEYTHDVDALARHYPVMVGAAEFMLDWLIDDPFRPGGLTTCPSTSPENSYHYGSDVVAITHGCAMDIGIIRALFTTVLAASEALEAAGRPLADREDAWRTRVSDALGRLPEPLVEDGRLVEFDAIYPEAEHPHRHISPVFELCPGDRITVEKTPELAEAAARFLDFRGDSGTGWTLAWKARTNARLKRAELAMGNLRNLLTPVDSGHFAIGADGGGTYPNLFTACPPLMIEGNFGYVSALLELFVQDRAGAIELLPACPAELATGELAGLHLRGGGTLSLRWVDGRVVALSIELERADERTFRLAGREVTVALPAGVSFLDDLLG